KVRLRISGVMQRILITGANGLLGQKLVKLYSEREDVEVIASAKGADRNPKGSHNYTALDITSKKEVDETIATLKPDVIINTAAMTHVDQCELDPENCWTLNVKAVEYLAEAAK